MADHEHAGARMSSRSNPSRRAPVRRIVTGHDARTDGQSSCSDGPAPNAVAPRRRCPQTRRHASCGPPTTRRHRSTAQTTRRPGRPAAHHGAARNGTILRIADFPPDSAYDDVDIGELFREIGGGAIHQGGRPRAATIALQWFHKTPTLDYAIVLEGEVWALLDEDETLHACRATCSSSGGPTTPGRTAATSRAAWRSSSSTARMGREPADHHVRAHGRLSRQDDAPQPPRAAR